MKKMRAPSRFIKSRDGMTTLEFAFMAPVFMLLFLGIIEFAIIMFVQAILESATSVTSRTGKTGYTEEGKSRQQMLIDNVVSRTGGLLDPNLITVTMKTYSTFDKVNDPEPYIDANNNGAYNTGETYTDINGNGHWDADMGAEGAGGANDIVVYTVTYPWHIMTPIMSNVIGNIFTITSRTVVKNEPW